MLTTRDKTTGTNMKIIIADDRKSWMIEEDKRMACMRCSLKENCRSLLGFDCKKVGGDQIPKFNNRRGKF